MQSFFSANYLSGVHIEGEHHLKITIRYDFSVETFFFEKLFEVSHDLIQRLFSTGL